MKAFAINFYSLSCISANAFLERTSAVALLLRARCAQCDS
jgi:hypothetical protein